MPRYHFNVRTKSLVIEDLEGSELSDLTQARLEAIQHARGLMSEAILRGDDKSLQSIEICDEAGNLLLRVLFTEAFEARG